MLDDPLSIDDRCKAQASHHKALLAKTKVFTKLGGLFNYLAIYYIRRKKLIRSPPFPYVIDTPLCFSFTTSGDIPVAGP